MRSAALLLFCWSLFGCATASSARLRLVSSEATQATWSFVIDDRARGAEVLVDGRFRGDGCSRAGSQLRCELRGLFPGGHTVDVRLPAADLRRTVLIGHPWPARPIFVKVRDADEAEAAGKAGADGVVVDDKAYDPAEVVDAAHKHGTRALVRGNAAGLIETASADGVLGGEIPAELHRRFPEARAFAVDETATAALAAFVAGGDAASFESSVGKAGGLVAASGLVGDAAALTAPQGALMDKAALPILSGRRRHLSLREGKIEEAKQDGPRYTVTWVASGDNATLLINAGNEPWRAQPNLPGAPLDLLGGTIDEQGGITIKAHDVALLVRLPAKEKTRY